jgi:hypothetical protein
VLVIFAAAAFERGAGPAPSSQSRTASKRITTIFKVISGSEKNDRMIGATRAVE